MAEKLTKAEVTITALGLIVIALLIAVVVLVVVEPHNNPDDIINYPLNANQMAIENTMDKGMVEATPDAYRVEVVTVNR